ncbi:MAG: hypothetical protein JO115_15050 [Pseudonocardiales bacterium]|nr:hypothetical protein [Pseudonocardiales bacterium]
MALRILIEGTDAKEVAEELVRAEGLHGSAKLAERGERDKDWPTTIQWIVEITQAVGGTAGIVDSVLRWRDRIRERPTPPQQVLLYVGDYGRSLNGLTRGEVTDLLRSDPTLDQPLPPDGPDTPPLS